jgi:hypothetical protein
MYQRDVTGVYCSHCHKRMDLIWSAPGADGSSASIYQCPNCLVVSPKRVIARHLERDSEFMIMIEGLQMQIRRLRSLAHFVNDKAQRDALSLTATLIEHCARDLDRKF